MKLFFTCLFVLSVVLAQTSSQYVQAPKPVNYVDAKKFSGLWYEIARTYNSFEKDCVAATVEYELIEPLQYEVKNRCFDTKIGGKLIQYNGTAKPTNGNILSQIDMTYYWIFTREYRIIYLDEDYKTAVMVDKDMKYVWIMNREPFMKEEKLNTILASLEKHMDTSKLIYTPQDSKGRYK